MKKLVLSIISCITFLAAQAQCPISASVSATSSPLNNALLRYEFDNTSSYGTFTNPMGAQTWIDYGDGNTEVGAAFSGFPGMFDHNYSTPGTYTVTFASSDIDTLTGIISCTDTTTTTITVNYTSCATSIVPSFMGGTTFTFTANNPAGTSPIYYYWSFGDGNYGSGSPVTHTYLWGGPYTVTLTAIDSINACYYTNNYSIYVPDSNLITGYVVADTFQMSMIANPEVRVWLITYDSTTQLLAAIDSMDIYPSPDKEYTSYRFHNAPADNYRVKAHVINGPVTGTTFVPTYGLSSLYWNTATLIYHTGGLTIGTDIHLQTGTAVSGPGFIGGDVTLGANRGTSAGVPGLLIFLRDANHDLVSSTYTDANGQYSFSNLPIGSYSVYPESGGYATTAYNVTLDATTTSKTSISFNYDEADKSIAPKSTSVTDVNTGNMFSIYPNPANNKIFINWKLVSANAEISISDVTGKNVYSRSLNTNKPAVIDVSNLADGQYFITVKANGSSNTQKIALLR